jgi:hypothetical protein
VITVSAASEALQRSSRPMRWYVRAESWFNGVLLHEDVPISDGTENSDRTSAVPERLTLTVPREKNGFSWDPSGDDEHPLAPNGQRLRLSLGVEVSRGMIEWTQRGEYLITRAQPDSDGIRVEALGLLALIEEARLVAPYQPSGTLKSTLRGLLEPALTVVFDAALTDRSVPSGINYDEDRLGAVNELLDAWPAEARMTGGGYLYVFPPVAPTANNSVHTFAEYVEINGDADREGAINCVVARGTASDGGQVQGVAYDLSTGPHRYGGPFNRLPVPEFFASPLLTTVAQCRLAAQTRMNRRQRELRRPLQVTAPPLTYLQHGDVVRTDLNCTIESIALPLVPGSGTPMVLTLAAVPE